MSRNSLEIAVESYFMELLRTHEVLKRKQMRHADSVQDAEPDGIVVEAVQGEAELNGEAGHNLDVMITWRGGARSLPAQNDAVAAAMTECVTSAPSRSTAAQMLFATPFVILNENMKAERPDTKDSRRRVLKVPVIAKLA